MESAARNRPGSVCLSSLANRAPGTARKPVAPINVRLHPGGHLRWWSRADAHRLRPGLKERRPPDTGTAARRHAQRRRGTRPGSWQVDETYVKVKGRWTYLSRAVDSRGQTIDFLLSAKRDAAAA